MVRGQISVHTRLQSEIGPSLLVDSPCQTDKAEQSCVSPEFEDGPEYKTFRPFQRSSLQVLKSVKMFASYLRHHYASTGVREV